MTAIISLPTNGSGNYTRDKGHRIYNEVRCALPPIGEFDLALPDDKTCSISFLDGLLEELISNNQIHRVTFLTARQQHQEKLAKLSTLHGELPLFVRSSPSQARTLIRPLPLED